MADRYIIDTVAFIHYLAEILPGKAASKVPELHDRMVVAIARKYKVPLVTNDSEIIKSGEVRTVWD